VTVDEKKMKDSWKEYKEGPSDCIRINEVAAALKQMKRHKAQLVTASSRNDRSHRGYWNSVDIG